MNNFRPYKKAGRVIRLLGWIQIVAIVGIGAAVSIPVFAQHKAIDPVAFLYLLFLVFPVLYLVAGNAIIQHKEWGRAAGYILAILMLFAFPIGTIIGAYILWCLSKGWDEEPD